ELLVGDPGAVGRFHTRPRPAAAALQFAAFHGEHDVVAARIAADDFHFRAQHPIHHLGKLVGVGAGAGAADRHLLGAQVVECGDAGASPERHTHANLMIAAADPGEFGRVKLRRLLAEQWIEAGAPPDDAEYRAVLGADAIKPIGEAKAAGAFHVLHHDRGIARDVTADVPGEHTRPQVVTAADAVADVKLDVL